MSFLYLAVGLAVLVWGAETLVRHSSSLATRLRVPQIVIGLTIVAFGTSAPELVVSTMASLDGKPDVALGNVVGSNIYNVLVVLGVSALITPLVISAQLVRIDVPVMVAVSLLMLFLALDGNFGALNGALLVGLLMAYTAFQIRQGRAEAAAEEALPPSGSATRDVVLIVFGLLLLVAGSRALLEGAVGVARMLSISELVIGLTIVAVGTSLPETATSIVAALRGQRDIAVGNVVGSNVFNILGVLGVASLVAPDGIPVPGASAVFDIPVMVAVAIACLPIFFARHTIARWQGAVFVTYYIIYVVYVVLAMKQHDALQTLDTIMVEFVLPITALTFGVIAFRNVKASTGRAGTT